MNEGSEISGMDSKEKSAGSSETRGRADGSSVPLLGSFKDWGPRGIWDMAFRNGEGRDT